MKSLSPILIFSLLFISVLFAQETELIPNNILLTKNGLDASAVCVSTINRDAFDGVFKYGEQLLIDFADLNGLTKIENKYYPNVDLTVLSKKGDTISHKTNLYGLDQEVIGMYGTLLKVPILPYYPLLLTEGIYTGKEYTLLCTVRDTKSDNKLQMKMDFKVSPNPNPHLIIQKKGLSYSEIFFFAYNSKGSIIIDNRVTKNESLLLTLKDIEGYAVKNDKIALTLDYTFTEESSGKIIVKKLNYGISSKCKNGKVINPDINIPLRLFEIGEYDLSSPLILNLTISDRNNTNNHLELSTPFFIVE